MLNNVEYKIKIGCKKIKPNEGECLPSSSNLDPLNAFGTRNMIV